MRPPKLILLAPPILAAIFIVLNLDAQDTAPGQAIETPPDVAGADPEPSTTVMLPGYNVKDFGAVGDGAHDDSEAFQKALDATAHTRRDFSDRPLKRIVIPRGRYRITRTLKLNASHGGLHLMGTGVPVPFGGGRGTTELFWDGPEGGAIVAWRSGSGMRIEDIYFNGNEKAKYCVTIDSPRGVPWSGAAAHHVWRNVIFAHADVGFRCGTDTTLNSANMSFYDCAFLRNRIGFETSSPQHLIYGFFRCKTTGSEIAYNFPSGGCAKWSQCESYTVGTFLNVYQGGINAGTFHLDSVRPEPWPYEGKRMTLLRARGETNVKFTSLDTTGVGLYERRDTNGDGQVDENDEKVRTDLDSPLFVIGTHAQVAVESSIICGNIARLTGRADRVPTWLQFDNCRFRKHSDPRKDIATDEHSGYELRNCVVTTDENEKIFIHRQVKLPEREVVGAE